MQRTPGAAAAAELAWGNVAETQASAAAVTLARATDRTFTDDPPSGGVTSDVAHRDLSQP